MTHVELIDKLIATETTLFPPEYAPNLESKAFQEGMLQGWKILKDILTNDKLLSVYEEVFEAVLGEEN